MKRSEILGCVCLAFGRDTRREIASLPEDQLLFWAEVAQTELVRQAGYEARRSRLERELDQLVTETELVNAELGLK